MKEVATIFIATSIARSPTPRQPAGIQAPPKTWAEFKDAAIKIHEADPNVFLTDAPFAQGGWVNALLWQVFPEDFGIFLVLNGARVHALKISFGTEIKACKRLTLPTLFS